MNGPLVFFHFPVPSSRLSDTAAPSDSHLRGRASTTPDLKVKTLFPSPFGEVRSIPLTKDLGEGGSLLQSH